MSESRSAIQGVLIAGVAVGLVALGVAIGAGLWRTPEDVAATPAATAPGKPAPTHATGGAAASVTLTPEMVARAGIRTVAVTAGGAAATIRIPGLVQPNRTRQAAVTSLVEGRVTQVRAEVGQRVTRGQPLATVYSTEFAGLQTEFVGLAAELAAHGQQLTRTQRLAAIGAASRNDLESLEAEHARSQAALDAVRSQLELLGLSDQQLDALAADRKVTTSVTITAPVSGVISERRATAGANVDPAMPLFTIDDLSSVWIIGDVYERDLASVAVGSPVTVTTPAFPSLAVQGKVSAIEPAVQAETRTAKVRVELMNAGAQLRLGMYVDVIVDRGETAEALLIPRSAVQAVGDARIVYVASPHRQGEFAERRVEIAEAAGDSVRVISGLTGGEHVVSEGAFYLRAERERTAASPAPAGAGHQGH
jgi:RND family efflux transporter MFP subunit